MNLISSIIGVRELSGIFCFLEPKGLSNSMIAHRTFRINVEQLFRYQHYPLSYVLQERIFALLDRSQTAMGQNLARFFIFQDVDLQNLSGTEIIGLHQSYPRPQIAQFLAEAKRQVLTASEYVELEEMGLGLLAAGQVEQAYQVMSHPSLSENLLLAGRCKRAFIGAFNEMRVGQVLTILKQDSISARRDLFLQERIGRCSDSIEAEDVVLLASEITNTKIQSDSLMRYALCVDWNTAVQITSLIQDPRYIAEIADQFGAKEGAALTERLDMALEIGSVEGRDAMFFDLVMCRFVAVCQDRKEYNEALSFADLIKSPPLQEGNRLSISRQVRITEGHEGWLGFWKSHGCAKELNCITMPRTIRPLDQGSVEMMDLIL